MEWKGEPPSKDSLQRMPSVAPPEHLHRGLFAAAMMLVCMSEHNALGEWSS